jgi:hypothetical protein
MDVDVGMNVDISTVNGFKTVMNIAIGADVERNMYEFWGWVYILGMS